MKERYAPKTLKSRAVDFLKWWGNWLGKSWRCMQIFDAEDGYECKGRIKPHTLSLAEMTGGRNLQSLKHVGCLAGR